MNFEKKLTQANEKKESFSERVVTKAGNFELLYNIHGGMVAEQIPSEKVIGKDAIIIEGMGIDEKFAKKEYARNIVTQEFLGKKHSQKALAQAIINGTPIFLVDISAGALKGMENVELYIKAGILLELATGLTIAGVASKKYTNPEMTRRDFLKRGAALAMGAYLATPAITEGMVAFGSTESLNKVLKINDAIHPELETFAVEGRNNLIAQKSESIAGILQEELGRKPEIGIIIGTAHQGLAKALTRNENERIEEIEKFKKVSLKNEAMIIRFDFFKNDLGKQEYSVKILEDKKLSQK